MINDKKSRLLLSEVKDLLIDTEEKDPRLLFWNGAKKFFEGREGLI